MSAPTKTTAVLAAAALAVAAAGCGEKREAGTGTSASPSTSTQASGTPATTVKVSETEFKIAPASPKVAKAGVTEFEVSNNGKTEHALEIETPGGEIETEPIAPGKTATLKADLKAGTYEWYCPIGDHKDRGMKGEVTVAGGGSGSGSGSGGGSSKSPGGY